MQRSSRSVNNNQHGYLAGCQQIQQIIVKCQDFAAAVRPQPQRSMINNAGSTKMANQTVAGTVIQHKSVVSPAGPFFQPCIDHVWLASHINNPALQKMAQDAAAIGKTVQRLCECSRARRFPEKKGLGAS